jgi:xylan 1,4-beta-xylosidase
MAKSILRLLLFTLLPGILMIAKSTILLAQDQKVVGQNILLADPTIFYDRGTYYLYGTGSGKYASGFVTYTSTDLKTWQGPAGISNGYALKKGDAFGESGFWAPQVFKYKGKFYIAYAANEHLGIAVSDSPLGPFKESSLKSISGETKQIDPFFYVDDNGKKYMYYVVVANGGNRIFVAEMNDDMVSMKKETEKLCIEATSKWENTANAPWIVTEGPTVIKHKKLYYLLYSANDFRNVNYAVGYATSKSPMGPWEKFEGNPIIHKDIVGQNGSGHGDIVKGKNGDLYYVLHTHNSADRVSPRKTAIVKLAFTKDAKSGIDKLGIVDGSFEYLQLK